MANVAKGRYHTRYRVIALDPGAVCAHAVVIVQPALDASVLNDIALCVRAQEVQREAHYSLIEVLASGAGLQKLRDEIDVVVNPVQPVVFCIEAPGVLSDSVDETHALQAPAVASLYVAAESPEQAFAIARQALAGAAHSVAIDWSAASIYEYVRQYG